MIIIIPPIKSIDAIIELYPNRISGFINLLIIILQTKISPKKAQTEPITDAMRNGMIEKAVNPLNHSLNIFDKV